MSCTFSIGVAPGYVELGGQGDIGPGMDVLDAAYKTAQNHRGGVADLAERMRINAGTLQHKLNPNNSTHHLTLREAVQLQAVSGDVAILRAMAQQLGYVVVRAMPDQAAGNPVEAFMHFQSSVAEVTSAAADVLRPGIRPSRNGVRRLEREVQELMVSGGHLVRTADAAVPVAPGGGYAG